eukprot:765374-Hanusia_phi.AAC.2
MILSPWQSLFSATTLLPPRFPFPVSLGNAVAPSEIQCLKLPQCQVVLGDGIESPAIHAIQWAAVSDLQHGKLCLPIKFPWLMELEKCGQCRSARLVTGLNLLDSLAGAGKSERSSKYEGRVLTSPCSFLLLLASLRTRPTTTTSRQSSAPRAPLADATAWAGLGWEL